MHKQNIFTTPAGFEFPGISAEKTSAVRSSLYSGLKLTSVHITEAASYSMAMVARFALGLSADRADVCAIVNSTLSGTIALATLRHLTNAGSKARLFIYQDSNNTYPGFETELAILKAMQIEPVMIESDQTSAQHTAEINSALESSHNLILGLFDLDNSDNSYSNLTSLLNEARTPIHCIDCPLGINPDTGASLGNPLFASSTLSLGTVFSGLYNGSTYTGRHYLCDIHITGEMYRSTGHDLSPLFSEQPVIKISANKPQEED